MVELKVRISSKGQVVIPKIFRDSYKLYPEHEAIMKAEPDGVSIHVKKDDPIAILDEVSEESARRRKGKKLVYDKREFYEQYDKRAKRAGL